MVRFSKPITVKSCILMTERERRRLLYRGERLKKLKSPSPLRAFPFEVKDLMEWYKKALEGERTKEWLDKASILDLQEAYRELNGR
jgi:hypothetical protein